MQNTDSLALQRPSLPTGGGAISGLKGHVAGGGPDGAATLSLPLPVSRGRGYFPDLSLSYHSRAGNGVWGMGWGMDIPNIRLRTEKGVPKYDGTDEFIGPEGEVLVPVLNEHSVPETRSATTLTGVNLNRRYTVQAYRSRAETSFSIMEYWVPENGGKNQDFWVWLRNDGQVHLLGKDPLSRIADPQHSGRTAAWMLESSVSATGEQMYWQYRCEDEYGCAPDEKTTHPGATAQRYLAAIWYGNRTAGRSLPSLLKSIPVAGDWLFTLVLDYGERGDMAPPNWHPPGSGTWLCRQDCFSNREYGFEVRTRRLCQRVLMYHAITALAGNEKSVDVPQLVSSLELGYLAAPAITTLQTVQQVAYESDGIPLSLPSLLFSWQAPPPLASFAWQPREDFESFNLQQPWQMVDLNGEAIAGILYQELGAWWYRAPVRHLDGGLDAVTWDKATPLPLVPALLEGGGLMDLNGDGMLEWVVTAPGSAGYYGRSLEQEWQHFAPLSALPMEFRHLRARMADLTGDGLADLVLIGPKSVRLYCGSGDGWYEAKTVLQSAGITLPIPGMDARVMVAFSDIDGSGLQHLVEVRASGVRYWPSSGHGQFSTPVNIPGFSQPEANFNPEQLYMADTDGSGTTDLIYALSDHLLVYRNLSGNRFEAPFTIPFPDGVFYDRTCSLQVADIQGLSVASLLLTITHPAPHHWILHLSERKPWLLSGMNNHMGAQHTLHYRSSAQFWLDEKAEAVSAGKSVPACHLPLPLHTLESTEILDEITGNKLVSSVRYRHGVWDGREREFRGFGFVEVIDTDILASNGKAGDISPPSIRRSWYATGFPAVDNILSEEYWRGDNAAYAGYSPRFTTGSGESERVYEPDNGTAYWLSRGLKGQLLRDELYGTDDNGLVSVPYSVSENRPQVRLVEEKGRYPVIWTTLVESRVYNYEQVNSDPLCSQQVLLNSDVSGLPLRQVTISYPRRIISPKSPYPDTLPETLYASSFDEQQQTLHLTQQRHSWLSLITPTEDLRVTGLAGGIRLDVFTHNNYSESQGVTLETLLTDNLLADNNARQFAGQQQVWYQDELGAATTTVPAFPPRVAFTESAVLDATMVNSVTEYITVSDLAQAGYFSEIKYLFELPSEKNLRLWTVRQGYTTYGPGEHFWLPQHSQASLLTGAVTVERDNHDCVITCLTDAAGLSSSAEYDWRFLTPFRVTDANDNVHSVTLDALGRVTSSRFCGTENGVITGYSDKGIKLPITTEAALELSPPLPVAQCMVYETDSWYLYNETDQQPPHVVTLVTDRYDCDSNQQIRQQVAFSDGFGRLLQSASLQCAGMALQRAADGSLVTNFDGVSEETETSTRWAVTGRTEYDNKGQAIRTFQPYFLNDWRYVSDDSARQDLYADTYCYDPLGRIRQVITAKGFSRRTLYTSWFTVDEDENDTQETD
ncbi:SpvB/TcaC N-terminal domain-containing protein [Serratia sp. OS31]|uniref:SpvB/TcaC N-terminal domain-containing protein n=1 Tax=Serratia sp. OS31 TaxID=2760844 RepID=UPI001604484A|nr:SpvB/TcaC N-terminal domain-containing protein [Serratia sp. OS31]MBB1584756.1 virulence protein [Serratia sp. OS31]